MTRISEDELNYFDNKLLKYKNINHAIQLRRLELQSSQSNDCNIGGGRANTISRPTESIIVRMDSDIKLRNLELFRDTVQHFISELNPEQMEIFKLRWMEGTTVHYYSWIEIADLLHVSRPTIYRKRRAIVEKFAFLKD